MAVDGAGDGRVIHPGVSAVSAERVEGQAAEAGVVIGDDRDAASRAAAAAPVIFVVQPVRAVGRDGSGSADGAGPDQDNGAARSARALDDSTVVVGAGRGIIVAVVVPIPRASASAQNQLGDIGRVEGASDAAVRRIAGPGVSADASGTAVSASASARVAVVGRAGIVVIASAAGVSGSAPSPVASGITVRDGAVIDGDGGGAVPIGAPGQAADSLSLEPEKVIGSPVAVIGGGGGGTIGPSPVHLLGASALEAHSAHVHHRAVEVGVISRVKGEDASRAAVPGLAGQGGRKGRVGILRHPDDLVGPLALGA